MKSSEMPSDQRHAVAGRKIGSSGLSTGLFLCVYAHQGEIGPASSRTILRALPLNLVCSMTTDALGNLSKTLGRGKSKMREADDKSGLLYSCPGQELFR
jgi:hypothetical protein